MYKALIKFTDLNDSGHVYNVGDTYPREGYTPTVKRIGELSGARNKLGKAVIEMVDEPPAVSEKAVEKPKAVTEKKTRRRKPKE